MLKRIWNHLPQSWRLACLSACCFYGASKKEPGGVKKPPYYVCGPFSSNTGIGRGCRLYSRELTKKGLKVVCVDLTKQMFMPDELRIKEDLIQASEAANMSGPGTVIIHANPPQFYFALFALGKQFLKDKNVVAFWSWESEVVPGLWRYASKYASSIETPSRFTYNILTQALDRPVSIHSHQVENSEKHKTTFINNGVARCLCVFDAGSSFIRKNPEAVLAAFQKAYKPDEAILTFKVSHSAADPDRFQKFSNMCASYSNVNIITDVYNRQQMEELYLANDIYISLHRSEGFGLTIKEALNLGLYVVATGWSGNMDFMNQNRAIAVPYKLVKVNHKSGPIMGLDTEWAEPDIDACADILRSLRSDLLPI